MLAPERISLARLPTPLIQLARISADCDGAAIWMKRDDLTGLELSGNKVRKLEYIAADALASGADTLVTEGTSQSNHCRATAAVCAKLGLSCTLLLRPEPTSPAAGNHLLDLLFGAQARSFTRPHFDDNRMRIVGEVLAELKNAGKSPRWVPMGASEPLGCWGYIRAAAELADQAYAAHLTSFDVVVPISSGGTYAGLVLGKELHHLDHVRFWAVPVSDDAEFFRRDTGKLCRDTIEKFDLPIEFDEGDLHFIEGFVGPGYAIPYDAATEALRMLARREGLVLDPVYTAKAFCGLLHAVRSGELGRERPVIFIHTGGIFSDFAWPETLLGASAPQPS